MPSPFTMNRREFLKFAGLSAAALTAAHCSFSPQTLDNFADDLQPAGPKSRIYVLSDLHIGDNSQTCWYQQSYHEPFLLCILDEIIDKRDQIRELVLLGDIMDFWTYVPEIRPPSFQQIASANPNIFGPQGKLIEVLRALNGKVTVLQGNHDMGFTQADWDTIRSPEGFTPKLIGNLYSPLGPTDPRIALAHGHLYTMFNAPDSVANFPLGHYVTRSVANKVRNQLAGTTLTAADLSGQGAPNGTDISQQFGQLIADIPNAIGRDHDVVTLLMEVARTTCGMNENAPIILPSGETSSLAHAKQIYKGLWRRWTNNHPDTYLGDVYAMRALEADAESKYLGWFAQKLAIEQGAELVVMGHTHKPVQGLITDPHEGRAICNYYNNGFACPSRPDSPGRSVSFTIIDIDHMHARVKHVSRSGLAPKFSYNIESDSAGADTIVYDPMMDFSTYVTIDNSKNTVDLVRSHFTENVGLFIVPPPPLIPAGATASFWIQDKLGIQGSDGAVTYLTPQGAALHFDFTCPSGILPNEAHASPNIKILAKSARDTQYQPKIPLIGHPLFVRYMV